MSGYDIATGNISIRCRSVWSRTLVIGYIIAILACRRDNNHYWQHIGVSCMTWIESTEQFGNIFVLSDYLGHFTLKCHILLAKRSVGVGMHVCWIKESFIMELKLLKTSVCQKVHLLDKGGPYYQFSLYIDLEPRHLTSL